MISNLHLDSCNNIFIDPFVQGFQNLHGGITGKKVEVVARDSMGFPVTRENHLSLSERVISVAIGVSLIIPIVNILVLAVLKSIGSNYLYPDVFYPQGESSDLATSSEEPISFDGITSEEPETVEPSTIEIEPMATAAMIDRKRDALARLAAIENLVLTNPNSTSVSSASSASQAIPEVLRNRFEPNISILNFNIESLLQRYRTNYSPSKLLDFMDWANAPQNRHSSFRRAVERYDHRGSDQQHNAVNALLSNLAQYFIVQRARVASGSLSTSADTALKEQFIRVFDSVIDADNNCIDQMLSQIQTLVLDIIAEGDANCRGGSIQAKLINRAGLSLCKYRTNLLKEILVRQNRDEHHMADLERVATQRVAEILGLRGNIFDVGARYGVMLGDVDARVNLAVQTFLDEYKPLDYLLRELRSYHGTNRSLRNEILLWASQFYDLHSEAEPNVPDGSSTAINMNSRLSEDFDALPVSEGGNLTFPGLVLLLEKAKLIREIPSRI